MAHNLDTSNGRDNFAGLGDRTGWWHRLGQEMKPNQTLAQWRAAAGLGHTYSKAQAYTIVDGAPRIVDGQYFIERDDTRVVMSNSVTSQYQIHQPDELAESFERYISVDDRFQWDTMGSLDGGRTVFFSAKFNGDLTVGGDKHVARLLATTSYDATAASINQMHMDRVVCANTLAVALADKRACVRTSHKRRFDAAAVSRELSAFAQSVATYKACGDAMAQVDMSKDAVANFFKSLLDIPFDAKSDDISTRKMNQFHALGDAYSATVREGTERFKVWTALNAVTRYVDHDRSTRGGDNETEARAMSATFGSGALLKAKAWDLILPLIKDRVAVAA